MLKPLLLFLIQVRFEDLKLRNMVVFVVLPEGVHNKPIFISESKSFICPSIESCCSHFEFLALLPFLERNDKESSIQEFFIV
jgi:hypothetical protein